MPITKSAEKSLLVSRRRRAENLRMRLRLKEALRKITRERLNETFSTIDKAVKTHIIHANKAARLKARLAKRFSATGESKKTRTSKGRSRSKQNDS